MGSAERNAFAAIPFLAFQRKNLGSKVVILIIMLPKLAYSRFSINPSSIASVIHGGNSFSQFLVTPLPR